MKIIFFGTPDSCLYILKSINEKFQISAIVSKNVSENTEKRNFQQSEINKFALDNNIKFYQPEKIDESFINSIKQYNPDLFLVCAYGKILSKSFIKIPKYGTLNIHPSLLPKYGGSGYYGIKIHQSVIKHNEKETGVTIHFVTENYDEGPVIMQRKIIVRIDDTPEILSKRVLQIEHKVYQLVVKAFCSNKITVNKNKVIINE